MFAHAAPKLAFPFLDSLGHFFGGLAAAFSGAQAANRVYGQLSRLSDAQLAARGLTREDVARLTLEALSNLAR